MYLELNDRHYYIDIETDGLKPTRIWCMVAIHIATGRTWELVGHAAIKRFFDEAPRDAIWVGHNIIPFDVYQLNRLLGTRISFDDCVDTLVLSYLYHPTMPGGHSLDAWGIRLKSPKLAHDEWDRYSPEMLGRCVQDARLGVRVWDVLSRRIRSVGFSDQSIRLEHQIRAIVSQQERNGWFFDIPGAQQLYSELRTREGEVGDRIKQRFRPSEVLAGTYTLRTKQDGSPYQSYLRHLEEYDRLELRGSEYDVYKYREFNIGSPQQRVERLLSLGWEPTKFTPKTAKGGGGNPVADEESILGFAEASKVEEVGLISEWLVYNGRANMINTWLNNVDYDDSRMHGRVFTCGAGTRRMTHSGPNTANVPSSSAKFGSECRSLWTVDDPRNLRVVGYDAKAAQMRMFGHYLNNPDVAKLYIEGDPHQRNADAIGIPRGPMKNVFYAFIFGAQDKKLGATAGGRSASFGKFIRRTLFDITPGLEELTRQVAAEMSRSEFGWIKCIDGGYVRCPASHAGINYKIQSAEAVLMKTTSVIIDQRCRERGIEHLKIGDIHDEGQHQTSLAEAEEFGKLSVGAIRDAGEQLGFRVPMDGDYRVGQSWADTH